jgi:hypothetical protein
MADDGLRPLSGQDRPSGVGHDRRLSSGSDIVAAISQTPVTEKMLKHLWLQALSPAQVPVPAREAVRPASRGWSSICLQTHATRIGAGGRAHLAPDTR